uniref:Tc1-like transposase DDE domain-containing protein n=1 Tax=Naja naja TaxID=35670 RepID=A0A8C6XEX7_NAJNA
MQKKLDVFQSAVSKNINRKLCGREKCGRKRCTSSRDDRSLERIVRKRPFKSVGDFNKEWTEAGVSASRATTHRRILDISFTCCIFLVKPLLNNKCQKHLTWAKEKQTWSVAQWSKVLFSDESNFCISFENQGPRVWRKNGEEHTARCLKSSVKFPQSVLFWGAMASASAGPLCFIKSRVNAAVYQILEHFMLPSADELYGDADFIFQQNLAPAHTAKSTKTWFNDRGITVLDWPTNSPYLNPLENLWGIAKRKMRDMRPNNAEEVKAAFEASWSSITPQQCHKLIAFMPCHIEAVIAAKGAQIKYTYACLYFSEVRYC